MSELQPGIYQHYKGDDYQVYGVARHEETHEELVVYQALYKHEEVGDYALWVRPKNVFLEEVEVDGERVPRFKRIG